MVPKIEEFSVNNLAADITKDEKQKIIDDQAQRAFQRGAMNFEDYNYDQYN